MKKITLREIGFIPDDVQKNHWNHGDHLLYQDMYGEYILATFSEDGDIEILKQEGTLHLMKMYLLKYFKCEFRERRLSELLD